MSKAFTADELDRMQYLSWPQVSPDAAYIAYVQSYPDEQSGLFFSDIHVYDCHDQREVILHAEVGEHRKQPRFTNNGLLYYLSDKTGAWQIHVLNIADMQSTQVSSARHGVERYSVCDDGSRLVFEATLWPEEVAQNLCFREMSASERLSWEQDLDMRPYYITELCYKRDEWAGMRHGEYSHLCCAERQGECTRQTLIDTRGVEATWPAISGDGSCVVLYGYPYSGAKGRDPELMSCSFGADDLRQVSNDIGLYADHFPQFSRDASFVVCAGFPTYEDSSTLMQAYKISLNDGTISTLLNDSDESVCHGLNCLAANRSEYGEPPQYFYLTSDDRYLYFVSAYMGVSNLYRKVLDSDAPCEVVIAGNTDLQEFAIDASADHIAYLMANEHRPAELFYDAEQLSSVNAWLCDYSLGEVRQYWCDSKDASQRLQYYLVLPVGYQDGCKVPAVLYVKGGPETIYLKSFWHQFQALAARGFAVICPNHRGSVGFGRAFCADGVCWKQEAMQDCIDVVQDVIARGIADPTRLGVTGGSYGGYMTNKLIGRTKLFAAAVTQRSLVNPVTSYGTGDMGFVSSGPVSDDFTMLDYLLDRAHDNIISRVDSIETPLLILHSFQDYRCSFEQAEQLFIALHERKPEVPVRLVAFPGETHELTRTGKLYHQKRHLQELLAWFETYLGADTTNSDSDKEFADD